MADGTKFVDFNLQMVDPSKETNKFEVSVLPSSEIEGTREPTSVTDDFGGFSYELKRLEDKKPDLEELIDLGKKLADRLLPIGKVRDLFLQAIGKTGADGGVRLRLWIRGHKLAQIPWEYSYLSLQTTQDDGDDRNSFLVLNPKISLVRHEGLEEEYPSLQAKTLNELSLVMAFANVQDKSYPPLKLDKEKDGIERALHEFESKNIKLDWESLENSTIDSLRSILQKRKPDVFHFAGHGDFVETDIDPATGEPKGIGGIVLLDNLETKAPNFLSADALARELSAAGVRVAILGACRTGRRDGISAWTGVAPALIKMGIPIVVAMQYEVKDASAIAFSKWFYTSLANGLSIDEAVGVARRAMLDASKDENNLEWGVPIVYMRSRDSILIPPVEGQPQSETSDGLRLIAKVNVRNIRGGTFTALKADEVTTAKLIQLDFTADLIENADITVMLFKNL